MQREPALWCLVSAANRASVDLHREPGFAQVSVGASFQGAAFTGGGGRLLRAGLPRLSRHGCGGRRSEGSGQIWAAKAARRPARPTISQAT